MIESEHPTYAPDRDRAKRLRVAIYIALALQVLIWLGLFVYIARHANPKGDGMEWVALMPESVILILGIALPLAFSREGRMQPVGLIIAGIGTMLSIAFFFEIVREFAGAAR